MMIYAFAIGFFAGLRSLTPPAATAWAARLGWLHLENPLSLIGSLFSVVIFTVLAVAELVADKLPQTPDRTDAIGLVARILTGAFTGACVASSAGGAVVLGGILGAAGGVAGAFGGYAARKRLVQAFQTKGLLIALLEDIVAIAGSIWIVSR
jgi:uncharacterized membrane protein